MTLFTEVYYAFLAQIQDDEWSTWSNWEKEEDWHQLLFAALPWFKFPRISLACEDTGFVNTLTNNEIQVIVNYMKFAWLGRIVDNTENLATYYSERDFSPALSLKQLDLRQARQLDTARKLEAVYYRSVNGKPYDYGKMAGG